MTTVKQVQKGLYNLTTAFEKTVKKNDAWNLAVSNAVITIFLRNFTPCWSLRWPYALSDTFYGVYGPLEGIKELAMSVLGMDPNCYTSLVFSVPNELQRCFRSIVLDPVGDGLVYRGLIQKTLLRDVPKAVLKEIAPKKVWMVDSTLAKVLRVMTTAGLYSRANEFFACNGGAGFILGMIAATMTEIDGSIERGTLFHVYSNAIFCGINFVIRSNDYV